MDNFDRFYQKALFFLSFRPRSEQEVRDYLKKKSFFPKALEGPEKNELELVIDSVVKKLKEQKFLDDEQFAKWFIEQRTRIKPKAQRVIKIELQRKGISKDLIEGLIGKDKKGDFEKALELAKRRVGRYKNEDPKKIWEKMARYLSSKGFDYDIIKEVIDQVFSKEYNNY